MIYGIWTFCAALLAFIISAVTGKFLIPYLRKLHFGQTILEEGPKWHKGKQGTPTMGGIMFIVAIVVVTMISTVIYAFTCADICRQYRFLQQGLQQLHLFFLLRGFRRTKALRDGCQARVLFLTLLFLP